MTNNHGCICENETGKSRTTEKNLLISREVSTGLKSLKAHTQMKHKIRHLGLKKLACQRRTEKTWPDSSLENSLDAFKEAVNQMEQTNAAIMTINECNLELINAGDESTFLQNICQIVTEIGGFEMAWFGYIMPDAHQEVLSDREKTFCCRTPKRSGYTSSISIPVYLDGQLLGALNVCICSHYLFDQEATELLAKIADILGRGIQKIRTGKDLAAAASPESYTIAQDSICHLSRKYG
ncbi:MAG: GAF domain-containing protein [Vulcanimicrobiota bacterium]